MKIMNKVMQCFWGMALVVSLFACKDEVEDADVIQPSSRILTFDDGQGQQTVLVKSTAAKWTGDADANWIFPEISATGDKFSVSVDENTDFSVRSAVLTIRGGNCICEIDVLQKGKEVALELTAESGVVYDLNRQYAVGVKTKQNWKARVEGNWLQIDKTEGTGNDVIKMTFDYNQAAAARTAKVVVTAEDLTSRTFTLEQKEVMPSDRQHDSIALVALYHSLKGETWENQGKWLTNTPINNWEGVRLNSAGRIVGLAIVRKNVGAEGYIAPEIKYLTYLEQFSMLYTEVGGTLPNELGRCVNLLSFAVNNAEAGLKGHITGGLPPIFCALSRLNSLDLSVNEMSGELPWEYMVSIRLSDVNIGSNRFSGELPGIWGKSQMAMVNLSQNEFSGTLPEEWGDSRINYINVSVNKELGGKIPESYCRKMKTMDLELYYRGTEILPCD